MYTKKTETAYPSESRSVAVRRWSRLVIVTMHGTRARCFPRKTVLRPNADGNENNIKINPGTAADEADDRVFFSHPRPNADDGKNYNVKTNDQQPLTARVGQSRAYVVTFSVFWGSFSAYATGITDRVPRPCGARIRYSVASIFSRPAAARRARGGGLVRTARTALSRSSAVPNGCARGD